MKEKLKDTMYVVMLFLMMFVILMSFYEFPSLAMYGGNFFNPKSHHVGHVKPGEWHLWLMVIFLFFPALASTVLLMLTGLLMAFKIVIGTIKISRIAWNAAKNPRRLIGLAKKYRVNILCDKRFK